MAVGLHDARLLSDRAKRIVGIGRAIFWRSPSRRARRDAASARSCSSTRSIMCATRRGGFRCARSSSRSPTTTPGARKMFGEFGFTLVPGEHGYYDGGQMALHMVPEDLTIELTILMPCLNEAETLGTLHRQGARLLSSARASTARSWSPTTARPTARRTIARGAGARVVDVAERGYGAALLRRHRGRARPLRHHGRRRRQLRLRRGSMPFVEKLREGYDLVMGNRFEGGIAPGAMPCAAPLSRQSGADARSAGCSSAARSATSIAGCAAFAATRVARARPAARPAWSSRREMVVKASLAGPGDRRGADDAPPGRPRAAAAPAHAGATAGATCASCCCSARAGCSSIPGSRCSPSASSLTATLYFTPLQFARRGARHPQHAVRLRRGSARAAACLFSLFARVSPQRGPVAAPAVDAVDL